MYFTVENIKSLNGIIFGLNTIKDEKEIEEFLDEHIEDTVLFLETIKKLNKKKLPKKNGKLKTHKIEEEEKELYQEEEIYRILCEKNNVAIMNEYSLSDLKRMYESIYNRKPTSRYTKERIINSLRNRMHTMKRAEVFAGLAEERRKEFS